MKSWCRAPRPPNGAIGTPAVGTERRDLKGRLDHLDRPIATAVGPHRRNVEAQHIAVLAGVGEPLHREPTNARLLPRGDRFEGLAVRVAPPRLNLAEHDR